MPGELDKSGRYNAHLISPLLDEVTHNPKILDAVESLIGKNILVCGTTLFIKNPNEKGFVSYHQDAKYIGLEPHNWVTAWVAITDSNEAQWLYENVVKALIKIILKNMIKNLMKEIY